MKRVVIIAGPNGAGKSTFARQFLPNEAGLLTFINADLIAAGLSPFAPETAALRAGRVMISEMRHYARRGESFAIETTLVGRRYERMIAEWQSLGYHVHLIYLRLSSPELAISRVAVRVKQGGHHVDESTIRRRFAQGLSNFNSAVGRLVNSWEVFDTSGEEVDWRAEGIRYGS